MRGSLFSHTIIYDFCNDEFLYTLLEITLFHRFDSVGDGWVRIEK